MKHIAYQLISGCQRNLKFIHLQFIDFSRTMDPHLAYTSMHIHCCLWVFWVSKCVTNAHHQTCYKQRKAKSFVSHFLAQLQVQRKLSYLDSSELSKGFHPVGKTPKNPIEIWDCLNQPFVNYNLAQLQCKCTLCYYLNTTKFQLTIKRN